MISPLKTIRTLSIALFCSGALNLFLIAFVVFWAFVERPPTPYFEHKPVQKHVQRLVVSPTNSDLLKRYKAYSFDQLLQHLHKSSLVEDGFTERDLALGVLVAIHDFNLEKALEHKVSSLQKRVLSFGEEQEKVTVYPGITSEQYEKILSFANTEKWPFKSQGLFLLLKKEQTKDEPTLHEAFYLTEEFSSLEPLFKKSVERSELIAMIQEGEWGLLQALNEKQKVSQDLTDENRQKVLLAYLKGGSKTAAKIMIKTDFDFSLKRLSDPSVLLMVAAIDKDSEDASKFLSSLASSPRGDQVKSLATAKYQEITGKKWEPLVSRETTPKPLAKTLPFKPTVPVKPLQVKHLNKQVVAEVKPLPQTKPLPTKQKELLYVVKEGDTLWKISKQFKVKMEEITKLNKLISGNLKPGSTLRIPLK